MNGMITGTDVKAVNPSVRHSECEFFVELNQEYCFVVRELV